MVVRIAEVTRQKGVVTATPEGAWTIGPEGRPGEVLQLQGGGSTPLDGLMRAGMDVAVRLRSGGLEPGRIGRLTVLVGDVTGLIPADGDLGEGDHVCLLDTRSLLLGIARATRYAGVDNPRLWTTADVRAGLEALGLPGRGPVVEELNGEGFPYSPYVLRRPGLMAPAAMAVMADSVDGPAAASLASAPSAPSAPSVPSRRPWRNRGWRRSRRDRPPGTPWRSTSRPPPRPRTPGSAASSRTATTTPLRSARRAPPCSPRPDPAQPARRRPVRPRRRPGARSVRCTSRKPRAPGRRSRGTEMPGTGGGCCSWRRSPCSSSCSVELRGWSHGAGRGTRPRAPRRAPPPRRWPAPSWATCRRSAPWPSRSRRSRSIPPARRMPTAR